MRFSTFHLIALILGSSNSLAKQTYHLSKSLGGRTSGKARSDMITSLQQCQQVCHNYFAAGSASSSDSSSADSSTITDTYLAADLTSRTPPYASSSSSTMLPDAAAVTTTSSTSHEVVTPSSSYSNVESSSVADAHVNVVYTASTSSSAAVAAASTATGDEAEFVNMHNAVRAKYGASDVTWNSTLATYATSYAKQCQKSHSGGPYGENLAFSVGYQDAIATGVNGWAGEASSYSWNSPGFSETTGHFTQMVWKATTSIGCAHVECPSGSLFDGVTGTNDNVVCEYYPRGNVEGDFPANVGELVA